jgi:hypothetical protein
MYLVQILLPTSDNDGRRFERGLFESVRAELTERFGGVTAFVQSPALGLWRDEERGTTTRDQMVLVEVMTARLNRAWWRRYRRELEARFRQDAIVVRALAYSAV